MGYAVSSGDNFGNPSPDNANLCGQPQVLSDRNNPSYKGKELVPKHDSEYNCEERGGECGTTRQVMSSTKRISSPRSKDPGKRLRM